MIEERKFNPVKFARRHRYGLIFAVVGVLIVALATAIGSIDIKAPAGRGGTSRAERIERRRNEDPFSEAQKAIADGYGDEDREVLDLLEAYEWTGDDGKGTASFKNGRLTETLPDEKDSAKGVETVTPLAIVNVSPNAFTVPQDGTVSETDVTLLDQKGGYHLLRIVDSKPREGSGRTVALVSDDLFRREKGTYTNAFGWKTAKITNADEPRLADAVDDKVDELEDAIKDYLKLNCAYVKEVTWDERAVYDYALGTVELGFTLKNANGGLSADKSKDGEMTVSYHSGTGEFEIASMRS